MEDSREDYLCNMSSTPSTKVVKEIAIEAKAIFKVALSKLGSDQQEIQIKTTHDGKYFAILDVQITSCPHTEQPKRNRIYSYFHDTIEECEDDAYSGALDWLQSKFDLIIDTKANKRFKDEQEKLQVANARASIVEGLYIKTRNECKKLSDQKHLAMSEMLAAAKKMQGLLWLAPNTTPLKAASEAYPHMIYIGQDPPKNEKERLAECLSKVFSTLRLIDHNVGP